jgi:serine protease Do
MEVRMITERHGNHHRESGGPTMIRPVRSRPALVAAILAAAAPIALAEMPPQPKEQATLVVEGLVRESFRSVRSTRIDSLFEIEVRSAQPGRAPSSPLEGLPPRPGDLIYVLAFQRRPDAPQVPGPVGYRDLPAEQDVIRAYLYPRNGGGWQFAYPLGFERIGRDDSPRGPEPAPGGPGRPRRIGILAMPIAVGDRAGLQVTAVTPGTPAHRAGLEPGDVILEADGLATRTLADLASQVARAGGRLRLTIRNVRDGRIQALDLDLGGPE